ncbi:MAG: putative aminohydrolase SsnA [Candidatus Heimdallarchaeota archaeon]|nr:putative aminohydrolase SsnA [Candidatus Heimdallarchaeota archaeon]
MDRSNSVIPRGSVYIENDKIVAIGPTQELREKYKNSEQFLDAKGRVVMPGFTCAHMHHYSAFATGMPLPPFPKGFVSVLKNLWWKIDQALDKDAVYYSALLGNIQAIKSGTTYMIDHHASPAYVDGSLDLLEKAARELGVKSNLCYEVTNRNGEEEAQKGLSENERFLKKHYGKNDDFISGLVGLHASFTLDDAHLERAAELEKEFDTGVHIHVAEDKSDMEHAKANFGSTVMQRLEKFNILNEKSLVAHCIHTEDLDLPLMKKYNVNVSHQPRSNMNNAVGTLDIFKVLEEGIDLGMGTDGMSADMKAELMVAPLIHKHNAQDNTVGTVEVYDALMKGNPRIIEKINGLQVGRLETGLKADLIISNYYPKAPINSDNVLGHVMFGVINVPVATTITDGKPRMIEGRILGINEYEISKKCQEIAPKIWQKVAELPEYE